MPSSTTAPISGIRRSSESWYMPGIGSICSGGRYDDLAGLYTKSHLPGIGASLGVDRLLTALEELGRVVHKVCSERLEKLKADAVKCS